MDARSARLVVSTIDQQLSRMRERTVVSGQEVTDLFLDLRLAIEDIAHLPWNAIEVATPSVIEPAVRRHKRSRRVHFIPH